jgi:lipopolysaccharide/colanic/teichoic acid biosynthesis glycosyltransferase
MSMERTVTVSLPARSMALPRQTRLLAQTAKDGAERYILTQRLFESVLSRERKRAIRSDRPLVLMRLRIEKPPVSDSPASWNAVLTALVAAIRDTDVVGWIKPHAVAGVIFTDSDAIDQGMVWQLESRFMRYLALQFPDQRDLRFSIQFQVDDVLRSAEPGGNAAAVSLPLQERRLNVHEVVKRGLDIVGSSTLLVGLSPLFLVIAALVKLSPGPVFFRQTRVGQHAKPFTMLKFRTMHVNNDAAIHQAFVSEFIRSGDVAQGQPAHAPFKITNDPRVTPVGRLLRKTSLDELPQLLNVLDGTMSLVGPRPPIQYEVDQYKRWHRRRVHEVKPGITGLWQVKGRSRTTFDDMVRLDLRYAKKRSLWTDIKILLATPGAVIAGKGAC